MPVSPNELDSQTSSAFQPVYSVARKSLTKQPDLRASKLVQSPPVSTAHHQYVSHQTQIEEKLNFRSSMKVQWELTAGFDCLDDLGLWTVIPGGHSAYGKG